jgi:hypothetical protein
MAVTTRDLYTLAIMAVIMQEYFWQRDINKGHCEGKFWSAYSESNLLCSCANPVFQKRATKLRVMLKLDSYSNQR